MIKEEEVDPNIQLFSFWN